MEPETKRAISDYQEKRGLLVTGTIEEEMLKKLRVEAWYGKK